MKYFLALVLVFLASSFSFAQEQKTEADLPTLISKLGVADFDTREVATERLVFLAKRDYEIVKKIKDLYKKTKDPEIKARAHYILLESQNRPPKEESKLSPKNKLAKATKPPEKKTEPAKPTKIAPRDLDYYDFELDLGTFLCENPNISLEEVFKTFEVDPEYAEILRWQWEGHYVNVKHLILKLKRIQNRLQKESERKEKKIVLEKKPMALNFKGLAFQKANDFIANQFQLKPGVDLIVSEVKKGSWGAKSGFKKHDLILTIDNQDVKGVYLFDIFKDTSATVEVIRKGKKIKIKASQMKD